MKNLIIGVFAAILFVSCGTSKESNDKSSEKENVEKPKAKPAQKEIEEM
jgi:hypothetical protein|tara:strand:- start:9855 stop:10001 length:147 start_codon:yes stop_codon:yes gene_type:complete